MQTHFVVCPLVFQIVGRTEMLSHLIEHLTNIKIIANYFEFY